MAGNFHFEYDIYGAGAPLVLLHGALADRRMWSAAAQQLGQRYRVYAYTQRYFGTADWQADWPPFHYDTHAADLNTFLREVVSEPAHVVAWSYGADVALLAAVQSPAMFRTLFLYELGRPTHIEAPDLLEQYGQDAGAMFAPVFQAVAEKQDLAACVEILMDGSGMKAGYFQSQSAARRALQLENARTLPLQLNQPAARAVSRQDIAALNLPICFARGAATRPLFSIAVDAAAACSSTGAHLVIPNAAHMLPNEDPPVFARAVMDFLAGR